MGKGNKTNEIILLFCDFDFMSNIKRRYIL